MTTSHYYSALDVAEALLALAAHDPAPIEPMTPLKLQQLLYYAQGYHLALCGDRLLEEPIEAWQHGPVVAVVFHHYKHFRGQAIAPSADFAAPTIMAGALAILTKVYARYAPYRATQLSAMTHNEPPWMETPRNHAITIERMKAYFIPLLCAAASAAPPPFTPAEREWVLDSVLASQAMEGVIISRERAAQLLDELEGTPLPQIG